ncbi:hypothetical protein ACS0TY_035911 [Phlomoides rotata]
MPEKAEIVLVVEEIIFEIIFMLTMLLNRRRDRSRFRVANVQRLVRYMMVDRIPQQLEHMNELTQSSDVDCFNNFRMNRDTFNHFCYLLRHSGGLVGGRYVSVGEQVAIFLIVLSHHSKVRVVNFFFKRSSHTVHQHFHNVLTAVLNLHGILLASPTPVDDECTHPRWKHFKGWMIVGLMDAGTADPIRVPLWNRNERGRCGWSLREEEVLSDVMNRIVSEGWKTGNEFKSGYLNLLYTYIKQVLPNTDLKPEPHINSRIIVWKKNYHSFFEIVKHTGVGLDSTTKMVDTTDDQWEAFMKKDPNARHMRHNSWPLYADWCEIFSQSRATGESTQSHLNAIMPPQNTSAPTDVGEGSYMVNDENVGESETHIANSQTGEYDQEMGKTAISDRKRKFSSTSDPFVNVVHKLCNTTSDRLGEIAQRIGYDQDMSTARKNIYSSVSKMDTLTLQEKLRAITMIARHAEDIDMFLSLPCVDRLEWVLMLLNGDIYCGIHDIRKYVVYLISAKDFFQFFPRSSP